MKNKDMPLFQRAIITQGVITVIAVAGSQALDATKAEKKKYAIDGMVVGTIINFVSVMMTQQLRIDLRQKLPMGMIRR